MGIAAERAPFEQLGQAGRAASTSQQNRGGEKSETSGARDDQCLCRRPSCVLAIVIEPDQQI
jgi:hypothetical protein